ncbi:MAG: 30S ribosomal protein S1 [Candidatus Babeliales bacterium]
MAKELLRPELFRKVNKIITDNDVTLDPEQLKELASLYEETIAHLRPGQLISAKIVRSDSGDVAVDIGYKSDGFIPRYEFSEHELKGLKPGLEIEVLLDELENVEGNIVLSYEKAKAQKAWDTIMKLYEEGKPVEGIVLHKVKGGLSVDIGVPAFLPGSQVDLQRVADFDKFVGQTITAEIIKINKKRGNVIISRRKLLSEKRDVDRKKVLETLHEGSIIQGIVKNITNYGVFIDIGGVDGLLHITDMTWGRISHPSEIVRIGQTIPVKVLSIDKDNNKISLGMKQLTDNPWEKLSTGITEGSKIKGKISSITDYGMFIEVAPGVEGLIHISEISWTDRIKDLNKHYKIGSEVESTVVSIDNNNRRMSLSIKQLQDNPWEVATEKFKAGEKIKGKISNITDFGIFIQLLPGVDGLAHVSDLSWTEHINHPKDVYTIGQDIEAVVLSVDKENKKISLGIKQLDQDPWTTIEKEYPVNSIVDGEVAKITNFGAFIKLPSGIEGLAHSSGFGDQKVEDVLTVGQKRQFRVTNISKDERKIGLSIDLEAKSEIKKAPKKAAPAREEAPKTKSLLQLELEKLKKKSQD